MAPDLSFSQYFTIPGDVRRNHPPILPAKGRLKENEGGWRTYKVLYNLQTRCRFAGKISKRKQDPVRILLLLKGKSLR